MTMTFYYFKQTWYRDPSYTQYYMYILTYIRNKSPIHLLDVSLSTYSLRPSWLTQKFRLLHERLCLLRPFLFGFCVLYMFRYALIFFVWFILGLNWKWSTIHQESNSASRIWPSPVSMHFRNVSLSLSGTHALYIFFCSVCRFDLFAFFLYLLYNVLLDAVLCKSVIHHITASTLYTYFKRIKPKERKSVVFWFFWTGFISMLIDSFPISSPLYVVFHEEEPAWIDEHFGSHEKKLTLGNGEKRSGWRAFRMKRGNDKKKE